MRKHQYSKMGLFACVLALVVAGQVRAADLAKASGDLADVSVSSVQASAGLAAAASSGDVGAIADAQKRAQAIDNSVAEANEAFAKIERANAAGDEDAAAAAADDLAKAKKRARDATGGPVPEDVAPVADKKPSQNSKVPNINDVPWNSSNLRSLYQSLFDTAQSANAYGGVGFAERFGDRNATQD